MKQPVRDALRIGPGPVEMAGYDSGGRPVPPPDGRLVTDAKRLRKLQQRLWAEGTAGRNRSVVLVLQGIDTAGKGGVTKHVFGTFGPIGVQYTGFKAPTEEERAHDFLWRIRKRLPGPGVIGVFDRSHYEDVLIVRVHNLVPAEEWAGRYDLINTFEKELVDAGTTVLKCFLNISFDTQRERLLARLDDPDKHWKFNPADLDERARWSEYQLAFEAMLEKCNTAHAPWYLVPSDHKKYRNWAIGELLRESLEELNPHWPRPPLDVHALRARLAPPH